MKKIIAIGLASGTVLLILNIVGIYATIFIFPSIAAQYYDSTFNVQSERAILFFLQPLILGVTLAWFWTRTKGMLTGSFVSQGIEFGVIYTIVSTLPMMWLIYSTMNVSIELLSTWVILSTAQGTIAGLIFEKIKL